MPKFVRKLGVVNYPIQIICTSCSLPMTEFALRTLYARWQAGFVNADTATCGRRTCKALHSFDFASAMDTAQWLSARYSIESVLKWRPKSFTKVRLTELPSPPPNAN